LTLQPPESVLEDRRRAKAEKAERDARQRDLETRQRTERRHAAWGALIRERGKRYENCRLSNFETTTDAQRRVVDALTEYAKHIRQRVADGVGLILLGPSGSGKDHLLIAVARCAVYADISVAWTSGVRLFAEARAAIGADHGDPEEVVRQYTRAGVLMVSDMIPPSQRLTDFQAEIIYRIADHRYSNMQPTWLSVNASGPEWMETALGVPVVDRFAHGAISLACDWPSYRRSARKG
jgi:DNA replication protein DnaC